MGRAVTGPSRSTEPITCTHPVVKHEHGTELCYIADMCGCGPCSEDHARRAAHRRRMRAYNRWEPARVPAAGTRRRLEALACNGWSMVVLADMIGITSGCLHRVALEYGSVSRKRAVQVSAVYEQLWNQQAPRTTKGERISANRVSSMARRNGWLPALAWDDETIDDPDALPASNEQQPKQYAGDRYAELLELGYTLQDIARDHRITVAGVLRAMERQAA